MLEGPSFAKVLHSEMFQHHLLAIYIDECHLVHKASSWRTAYMRLLLLRTLVGHDIPLVAISATMPSTYRESLHQYARFKRDYTLINLGNHRPELSTVIIPMEHDISSFHDITFLLPFGCRLADITPTIIYTDDLDVLTAMFWWAQDRLAAMGLPVELVDILHAGLTPEHQKKCLADFRTGVVMFLLASKKIGVGMNFANVHQVIQYLCRGLTLVWWEQRRGRCVRTSGMIGTGYLIAEPRMIKGTELTVTSPNLEDPGLLDLLQSDDCCNSVYDRWLENPVRNPLQTLQCCCSKLSCYPSLKPGREHQWIMVEPGKNTRATAVRTTVGEREKILKELMEWRLTHWQDHWRERWPNYGPKSLISDADLENVAKHAGAVHTVDDLRPFTHIIHWSALSEPLFGAVRAVLALATGINLTEYAATESVQQQQPAADQVNVSASQNARTSGQQKHGKLQCFENVIQF
jgi:hypothetical protein